MRRHPRLCIALAALAVLLLNGLAHATVLSFSTSIEFSGGNEPVGSGPWLSAVFDDGDTPGSVSLTLTALDLAPTEFISKWYFNLDPALAPEDLDFSSPTKIGLFSDPEVEAEADDFNVAGSGRHDIVFEFSTSNKGGGVRRFGSGESATFLITGIPTLMAWSFNFDSTGGGNGAFPTAAHVQGIPGGGSGWVSVPEPATLSVLALGGLAVVRRRKR